MAVYPDLAGKVAVVTGAAQATGRAIATALVGQGAHVVLADVEEARGAEAASALAGGPGRAVFQRADVSREDDVAAMVGRAAADFGRLDILVNNARSRATPNLPVTELELEDWDRTYTVLIRSHYLAAKHAIPHMEVAGGGAIIGISSVQGRRVSSGFPAYCSAKAAVDHLMRQIAFEYGPRGIRANAIAPGGIWPDESPIPTPSWASPEREERYRAFHPVGRLLRQSDVARLALFLASEESAMITGQSIAIDGGYTLALPEQAARRVFGEI